MPYSEGNAEKSGGLSLAQLVALNMEIAALSRAGLPLEQGLRTTGEDFSGKLRSAMLGLSRRMESGASLTDALAVEGKSFPPIYRAVVHAGVRAGRLPAALESLAAFIRGYVDARRAVGAALAYPLVVVSLAYGLFLFC
jgi:general secretion pathway protein F